MAEKGLIPPTLALKKGCDGKALELNRRIAIKLFLIK
jgi:hypothetical protein